MTSPKDFGWWIESTDEELYGPVTKATIARFLMEGVISPNTAVRHCTEPTFTPAADQGLAEGLEFPASRRTGDTLSTSWPKKTKDRMALGESDIQCAYHKRPAILTCIRCLAPYCSKCQMKKKQETYFMCKKCQGSMYNRRVGAYMFDNALLVALPTYGIGLPLALNVSPGSAESIINLIAFAGSVLFVFRDPLIGGAGPGKRLFSLRVVKSNDPTLPLSFGQGFLRCLAHLIPIFNLIDGNVAYQDPLQRRYGDKWAKTRVLDSPAKLEKARAKAAARLVKKGIDWTPGPVMTLEDFARIG